MRNDYASGTRLERIIAKLGLEQGKGKLLDSLEREGPAESGNALARRVHGDGANCTATQNHLKSMEAYGWVRSESNDTGTTRFGKASSSWYITAAGERIVERLRQKNGSL